MEPTSSLLHLHSGLLEGEHCTLLLGFLFGYHPFVMVFVQLDLSSYVQGTTGYQNELYLSPRQLDVNLKTCTLPICAELTVFPQEQTVSGGVKVESCSSKRGAVCLPLSSPASSAHDLSLFVFLRCLTELGSCSFLSTRAASFNACRW